MAGSLLDSLHEAYALQRAEALAASRAQSRQAGRGDAAVVAAPELERLRYGPADRASTREVDLIATFGEVQAEYAALRRGAGFMDCPHRATLLITGADRRDFLNRMVTQELKDLAAGQAKPAFWLNRKGRIVADLLIAELGERMLIDVDVHQAEETIRTLSEFIFTEDVEVRDASAQFHRLSLHGPGVFELLAEVCGVKNAVPGPGRAVAMQVEGAEIAAVRRDQVGAIGLELFVPVDHAATVWQRLLDTGNAAASQAADARFMRPAGWHAYNIARIEAGAPLFNIDFGPTNLPHETGVLRDRVSFTKGCYLGQEIVARMESRGHSKASMVGLRVQGDHLPVAGAQVFERSDDGSMGAPIGTVTSSTLSPMLGAAAIAFAMIKTAGSDVGTNVLVNAEGEQVGAVVSPLRAWGVPAAQPGPAAP